ncbi:phosphoglycerate mutase family protein [Pedobacter aquatilis]|uniref:phosphoglycerate mutase family protein n=1 Tax=Pedobacter aquatilis TaxID=351343 RepID=UPI0025B37072|nr:phosphoglycerate mutase family protein [Pedobacter aquatilis]MDN3586592.1 phosphoglycerate mutase family protein [Pedobacter aquatilis]
MKKFFCLLSLSILFLINVHAQTTEVWVVRHAEKEKSNPQEKNPDLSDEGRTRAGDLAKFLKKINFDAAYTTPYKRTRQTLDSLVIPKVIEYNDIKALVDSVKANYLGKKVIIAGHSNTVLEIIEAFGGKRPREELTDDDYDFIFRLNVKGDKAKVKMDQFGVPHHL